MKKKIIELLCFCCAISQAQVKVNANFLGDYSWGKNFTSSNYEGVISSEMHWLPKIKTSLEIGIDYNQPQLKEYSSSLLNLEVFLRTKAKFGIEYTAKKWNFDLNIQPEWNSYNNSRMVWNQLLGGINIKYNFSKLNHLLFGIQKTTLWGAAQWYPQISWMGQKAKWKWEIGFPKTKLAYFDNFNRWEFSAQQIGTRFKLPNEGFDLTHSGTYFSTAATNIKGSFQHQFDRYFSVEIHAGYLLNQTYSTWNANHTETKLLKENGLTTGMSIMFNY